MNYRLPIIGVMLALLLTSHPTSAELIAIDLVPGSNDQLLTHDTETGLDWLAVTETVNMSYDDVRTGIWYDMGFRHATQSQLRLLFVHAGTPDDGFDTSVTYPEETKALAERLGLTLVHDARGQRERETTLGLVGTDFFGNLVTFATHPVGQPFGALLGKLDFFNSEIFGRRNTGEAHFTGGHPFSTEAGPNFGSFLVRPHDPTPRSLVLHGAGATANPPSLTIDAFAPTTTSAKYKDSSAVTFSQRNGWREIGTWSAPPELTHGTLTSLTDLRVWLGLKNSDDQGTRFDLLTEVYRTDELVASGLVRCIEGITRNPASAVQVSVRFDPFDPPNFDGATEALRVRVLTRIGTNPDDSKCPGHTSAAGLRLYFDGVNQPSQLEATIP